MRQSERNDDKLLVAAKREEATEKTMRGKD